MGPQRSPEGDEYHPRQDGQVPSQPHTVARKKPGLCAAYGADGRGSKAINQGKRVPDLARRLLPVADPRTRDAIKVLLSRSKLVDDTDAAAALDEELKSLTKEGGNHK